MARFNMMLVGTLLLSIGLGDTNAAKECKSTKLGQEYRGKATITKFGRKCERWDAQTRYFQGNYDYLLDKYPSSGLEENFCRNPDAQPGGPWCYITHPWTSPIQSWQYCGIPDCPGFVYKFHFPEDEDQAYVQLYPLKPLDVSQFTITFSFKLKKVLSNTYFLSLSTTERVIELGLGLKNVQMGGKWLIMKPQVLVDSNNQYIATWDGKQLNVYLNGENIGNLIQTKRLAYDNRSKLLIGQVQKNLKGEFDESCRVIGDMYEVQMWDRAFSSSELKSLMEKKYTTPGNILSLSRMEADPRNGATMRAVDIDECLGKPCPNGESCRNFEGSYECYTKSEPKNIGKPCMDQCIRTDGFCYGKGFCGSGECCKRGDRGRGKCSGYTGHIKMYTCQAIDWESKKFKSTSGAFYFPEDKKHANVLMSLRKNIKAGSSITFNFYFTLLKKSTNMSYFPTFISYANPDSDDSLRFSLIGDCVGGKCHAQLPNYTPQFIYNYQKPTQFTSVLDASKSTLSTYIDGKLVRTLENVRNPGIGRQNGKLVLGQDQDEWKYLPPWCPHFKAFDERERMVGYISGLEIWDRALNVKELKELMDYSTGRPNVPWGIPFNMNHIQVIYRAGAEFVNDSPREDKRCGYKYDNAICNSWDGLPCCSKDGYCSKAGPDCYCKGCIDYRQKRQIDPTLIRGDRWL